MKRRDAIVGWPSLADELMCMKIVPVFYYEIVLEVLLLNYQKTRQSVILM